MKDNRFNHTDELSDPLIFTFIHDIKNMMVPIVSRIELLQVPGLSEDKRQETLRLMSKDCDLISNAMNAMVEICRCRGGRLRFTPTVCSVFNVVSAAMDMISDPTRAKGVMIENGILEDLYVYTDQEFIMPVFVNLLANAVKFCYRGGRVVVSAVLNQSSVCCKIQDNGAGLDIGKVAGILQRNEFYHSAGTEGEMGNGFGLMLCESLLQRAGTQLSYGNNDGGGAWFSFSLPLVDESKNHIE